LIAHHLAKLAAATLMCHFLHDIPGICYAIQPGQTGLLVPAKDEGALTEAI